MEITKTAEEQLQELRAQFEAQKQKTTQAEQALTAEREARGKAEQQLVDTNLLVDQLNQAAGEASSERKVPTATLGSGATAKKYRIVVPQFNVPGIGVVKAEDVKSNSDLLKKLVEVGSGVIELVE